MAPRIDRDTFLRYLEESKLLSDHQLAEVVRQLPDSDRGKVLARALVEMGLLTKFQAQLLLAGRTSGFLLGQYRILEQLGQGGMGRVFKAVHLTMNRVVALKLLSPQLVRTARAMDLFQREVRAAGLLIHPNIVTAYDANHIGDRHYLVMEYVDGPNLDQLVRGKGPVPVGLACEIIRQAAAGLQYAHEMGMVHRDIKPSNLLLQPPLKANPFLVKILDFGLARFHTSGIEGLGESSIVTKEKTVMGTPDYLSPEQSRDLHEVDIRSDLYSLGCTLYFLLAGHVPFPGGSSVEKLLRHRAEEPEPLEQIRPDLPAEIVAIVRKLMAKDPETRCQIPAELKEVVTPFADADISFLEGVQQPLIPGTGSDPPLSSSDDIGGKPSDSNSSQAATVPPDMNPTPVSHFAMPQSLEALEREDRHETKKALYWALAMVLGLVGAIALLLIFRG